MLLRVESTQPLRNAKKIRKRYGLDKSVDLTEFVPAKEYVAKNGKSFVTRPKIQRWITEEKWKKNQKRSEIRKIKRDANFKKRLQYEKMLKDLN